MVDKDGVSDIDRERSPYLRFSSPGSALQPVGRGELGGKARGLESIRSTLAEHGSDPALSGFTVDIPQCWVITTDWFDRFMKENNLDDLARSDTKNVHLANAFVKGKLPEELIDSLREIIKEVHAPLAIRSSSRLEDAMLEPFAGVYATKMIPNNQFSAEARLRTLLDAVKFVYSSTFFTNAKNYRRAIGRGEGEEKMAVMIQEVVGERHGNRFYPTLSGVARSYNFYSQGHARPEQGIVSLALGLGKTIVDGGRAWTYCPTHPRAEPPFGSTQEMLKQTQTRYWSVNMGKPPSYDPIRESEFLCQGDLGNAESDGVLTHLASTYNPESDRITPGVGIPGARVLNFAPMLQLDTLPLNNLVKRLLEICEEKYQNPVEIEFAMNPDPAGRPGGRFGFLQVRPMLVTGDVVEVKEDELSGPGILVASDQVLGNGQTEEIQDVVYVKPDAFSAKETWMIATELDLMNRRLLDAGRPYLLVVIGRLGTSDPWLGIPVEWGQVAGARAIVETSVTEMNVDRSQGSHFFHNVMNLKVFYFSEDRTGKNPICWDWLHQQQVREETRYVRHVALDAPLSVKVDGRSGRGVIRHEGSDAIRD